MRLGFAAREGAVGIYALDATRKRGDISGATLPFQFKIEDNTRGQGDPRHQALRDGSPYKVWRFACHLQCECAHSFADDVSPGEDYAGYLRLDVRGIFRQARLLLGRGVSTFARIRVSHGM